MSTKPNNPVVTRHWFRCSGAFAVMLLLVGFVRPGIADLPLLERDALLGDVYGWRDTLDERGITVEAVLTFDYSVNLRGGLNTEGATFRHLFDLSATLDTEALFGHPGGTVFMLFQNHNGPDASADDVGDLQAFSNIDADGRTQLAEFWFEQQLADNRVRITIGKVDVNGLFAFVDHGAEFIHSSPGFSPTILDFPSYPDPAMSLNVFIDIAENIYAGFGWYDGSVHEGILTGERGPSTFFHSPADTFLISELGATWALNQTCDGRTGFGVWHHTGTFDRFDGSTEEGTTGLYIVIDQLLWRDDTGRSIGAFAQYGYADPDVSEIEHHLGSGVACTGLLPQRPDDVAGVMASYAKLSDEPGAGFTEDHETAIECFYKVQLTPAFSLKPDLQYIFNPGGDASVADAIVATLRGELVF